MRVSARLHGPNLCRRSVARTRRRPTPLQSPNVTYFCRSRCGRTRPFPRTPALAREGSRARGRAPSGSWGSNAVMRSHDYVPHTGRVTSVSGPQWESAASPANGTVSHPSVCLMRAGLTGACPTLLQAPPTPSPVV